MNLLIKLILVSCLSFTISEQTVLATHTELTKEEYEKNRIVVRIWHYIDLAGNGVGHVSVQLPYEKDNYISFWPSNGVKFIELVPGTFNGLINDYWSEERAPDTIISLYTLNVAEIQKRFLDFKEQIKQDSDGSTTGWSLLGDCWLVNKGSKQHSCASLALALLKAGDLQNLFLTSVIPMKSKISYSLQRPADKIVKTNPFIVAPNDVADIAIKARKLERENSTTIQTIPLFESIVDLRNYPPDIDFSKYKNPPFFSLYQEKESHYEHKSPGRCLIV